MADWQLGSVDLLDSVLAASLGERPLQLALDTVSEEPITVFAEDLAEIKAFYEKILGLEVLGEETNEFGPSVVFRLGNIMINLAHVSAGPDFGAPGAVAPRGEGARVVLPATVKNVDEACAELARLGVPLLDEPRDRPWGIRCASFVDPAGHIWEIASDID